MRATRGHVLLGLLVLVGLTAAGIAGVTLRYRAPPAPALAWLVGGLLLATWSARAFWKRDADGAARLLLFCFGMPAVVLGIWMVASSNFSGLPPWLALGCAAVTTFIGVRMWKDWRRAEVLPNVLLEWAPAEDVLEVDGVHFAVRLAATEEGSAPLELHLMAQGCVDAERALTLKLSGPPESRLRYPRETTVHLEAGEVGLLIVPLFPVPGAPAPGKLSLQPSARGPSAPRLRHWRARRYEGPLHPAMRVLGLFAGILAWGGGMHVEVAGVSEGKPPPPQLPEARWKVLWRPGAEEIQQARAAA
ncbi:MULTISPECIES: hypothetical protein [unclassified Myxococcus]|uniref:hypothetical protein n=1 Tax=unclassified Myxococcus TaxID=2648731 RepID=UPI00157B1975|nr:MULTISPECIES: hypothetical protein [unclassified Myxococcus]NTX37369.1 hypothetical protein [Myxococcus sp. CA033]NTX54573.1 hypothetical protein [Myxococcus sp. CA039A]